MTTSKETKQSHDLVSVATDSPAQDASICPNCYAPKSGRFCHQCGQNDKDYSRSTFRVIVDFFHELFELDSRAARTLRVMFLRPGFLALEFANNRRANYITPIRLYLFSSIVCFFILSLQTNVAPPIVEQQAPELVQVAVNAEIRNRFNAELSVIEDVAGEDWAQTAARVFERAESSQTRDQLDQLLGYLMSTSSNQVTLVEKVHLRSLLNILGATEDHLQSMAQSEEQFQSVEQYLRKLEDKVDERTHELAQYLLLAPERTFRKDIFRNSFEGVFRDGVATRIELFGLRGLIHVLAAPRTAIDDFVDNLPIAMFLLLPAMTLMHKLLYITHRRALAQHLVFSIHLHVIAFIVLAIILLLPSSENDQTLQSFLTGQISLALFIGLLIHSFMAFRTFYQQSRFVTFLKFCSLGATYLVLLIPSIFIVGLFTMARF